ncbi:hypothetical protein ACWGDS_21940 [Streptomyces sp. NPDC055059]|uniref:hypothetical protein n=1 Tax=Streptomyces sp. NPDC127172 TaxID=3345382 RepID=UPI003635EC24
MFEDLFFPLDRQDEKHHQAVIRVRRGLRRSHLPGRRWVVETQVRISQHQFFDF